jgi:hypothetical protein
MFHWQSLLFGFSFVPPERTNKQTSLACVPPKLAPIINRAINWKSMLVFTALPSPNHVWLAAFSPVETSLNQNHRIRAQNFGLIESASSTPPRMACQLWRPPIWSFAAR